MIERFRLCCSGHQTDDLVIYHIKGGKPCGLPVAFIRQGMHKSAQHPDPANSKPPRKSIYRCNNRPGGE